MYRLCLFPVELLSRTVLFDYCTVQHICDLFPKIVNFFCVVLLNLLKPEISQQTNL